MAVFSSAITPDNIKELRTLWQYKTRSYVTGQPLYLNGKIFIADWQGYIYCLDERTGNLIYEKQLYQPPKQDSSTRNIPVLKRFLGEPLPYVWSGLAGTGTISRGVWYLTSVGGKEGGLFTNGAPGKLFAVRTDDGSVIWESELDDKIYSGGLTTPVCDDSTVYAGVQSVDESASVIYELLRKPYKPQSVGAVIAFNKFTGQIRWRRRVVDLDPSDNRDAKGASVWAGFELDTSSQTLYFGTGNNHGEPASKSSDALISISSKDGSLNWIFQPIKGDAWLPLDPDGPDSDFGSIPVRFRHRQSSNDYAIGAGNKNGYFYVLDSGNGKLIWKTFCHVGSTPDDGMRSDPTYLGGRIYVWSRNRFPLKTMSISCMDAESGKLIWHTITHGSNARSTGAITNGLYFLANYSGEMFAFDTISGDKVWSHLLDGSSVGSSLAIYNNRIYGGMGLPALFGGNPDQYGIFAVGFPNR